MSSQYRYLSIQDRYLCVFGCVYVEGKARQCSQQIYFQIFVISKLWLDLMRNLSIPFNGDCIYQVYYVPSQLVVIINLGCASYHWLNTDDSQSITKFSEPSNQYISHDRKKFGQENSEHFIQLGTFCLGIKHFYEFLWCGGTLGLMLP